MCMPKINISQIMDTHIHYTISQINNLIFYIVMHTCFPTLTNNIWINIWHIFSILLSLALYYGLKNSYLLEDEKTLTLKYILYGRVWNKFSLLITQDLLYSYHFFLILRNNFIRWSAMVLKIAAVVILQRRCRSRGINHLN